MSHVSMSHVASLRVATFTLATCAAALAISPQSTQAAPDAATCAAAPKSTAPEGRHWRYHLDRATNRKCWYLAAEGGRKTRSAAMVAPTAPEPQERIPAPPVSADGVKRLTQPLEDAAPRAAPPPPEQNTAPVATSAPVETAPAPVAAAPAIPERVDQPVVQERISDVQGVPAPADAPARIQLPTQPVAAPKSVAARVDADPMTMLPFGLGALAAALMAAGAILFASGARRRRETIVRIIDLNAKPRLPKAPKLADWSALSDGAHGDDNAAEEANGRIVAPRRRQAA